MIYAGAGLLNNHFTKKEKVCGYLYSCPPVYDPDKLQPQGFCNYPVDFSVCALRQRSNEDIAKCLKQLSRKHQIEANKSSEKRLFDA